MRDPARIPEFMAELCRLWTEHPDWRFGQLIFNAFDGIWDTREPQLFYISDESSLEIIMRRLKDGL
jgi:hypothetical protein